MADIRQKVLSFAKASVGRRIWARKRSYSIDKSTSPPTYTLKPLKKEYTWKNTKHLCSGAVTSWETGTIISFRGKNREAKKTCGVGHGECWDFVYAALDENKGLSRAIATSKSGRNWSNKLVTSLSNIKGGEIIEFNNYYFIEFKHASDGFSWKSGYINYKHSAIIGSVDKNGKITVYHQNFKGNRSVHSYIFPLKSLTQNDSNKKIFLAVGGNAVKNLISNARSAGSNIKKLNAVRANIEKYIKTKKNIPSQVKVYIPQSNP